MVSGLGCQLLRQCGGVSSSVVRKLTRSGGAHDGFFSPAAESWATSSSSSSLSCRKLSPISRSFCFSPFRFSSATSSPPFSFSSFSVTSASVRSVFPQQQKNASSTSEHFSVSLSRLLSSMVVRFRAADAGWVAVAAGVARCCAAGAARSCPAVTPRCGVGGTRVRATWAAGQQQHELRREAAECGKIGRYVSRWVLCGITNAVDLPVEGWRNRIIVPFAQGVRQLGWQARQTSPLPSLRVGRSSSGGQSAGGGCRTTSGLRPARHHHVRTSTRSSKTESLAAFARATKWTASSNEAERGKGMVNFVRGRRFYSRESWSRSSWRRTGYGGGNKFSLHFSRGDSYDRRMVWILMGANAAVFILWQIGVDRRLLSRHFQVSAESMLNGRFYTALTCAFSHADLWHLVANMSGLYFFGSEIAQNFGGHFLLKLYVTAAITASLAHVAYHMYYVPWKQGIPRRFYNSKYTPPAMGASGAVTGITLLYMFLFPRRTVYLNLIIPVPAALLGVLFILQDLYGTTNMRSSISHAGHLGGAAVGLLTWIRIRRGRFY